MSCFLAIKIKTRDSAEPKPNCILIYILIIMNFLSIVLSNIGCFVMFMFLRIIYRLSKKIEICGQYILTKILTCIDNYFFSTQAIKCCHSVGYQMLWQWKEAQQEQMVCFKGNSQVWGTTKSWSYRWDDSEQKHHREAGGLFLLATWSKRWWRKENDPSVSKHVSCPASWYRTQW